MLSKDKREMVEIQTSLQNIALERRCKKTGF